MGPLAQSVGGLIVYRMRLSVFMNFEKITVTLFDIFGYILPGIVLLFGFSVLEATFVGNGILSLSALGNSLVGTTIAAYYLGQISHRIGSWLKTNRYKWFERNKPRLSKVLYYTVRNELIETYSLNLRDDQKIDSLETYLLAETYLVSKGDVSERDSLLAREGFHKTSMIAFTLVAIMLLSTCLAGGMKIQVSPNSAVCYELWETIAFGLLFLFSAGIFRQGFIFYNGIKMNNILLLSLAKINEHNSIKVGKN